MNLVVYNISGDDLPKVRALLNTMKGITVVTTHQPIQIGEVLTKTNPSFQDEIKTCNPKPASSTSKNKETNG